MWPIKVPYIFIELGEISSNDQYEYAVGACPSKAYCWILSREPSMNPELLKGICGRLVSDHHFDLSDLEIVKHGGK